MKLHLVDWRQGDAPNLVLEAEDIDDIEILNAFYEHKSQQPFAYQLRILNAPLGLVLSWQRFPDDVHAVH